METCLSLPVSVHLSLTHSAAAKRVSLSLYPCLTSLMRKTRAFIGSHSEFSSSTSSTRLLLDRAEKQQTTWPLLSGQTGAWCWQPSLWITSSLAFTCSGLVPDKRQRNCFFLLMIHALLCQPLSSYVFPNSSALSPQRR